MQFLFTFLLCAALVIVQALIGGTRLLFLLPAVALVGLAAVLSVFSVRSKRLAPDPFCAWTAVGFAGWIIARGLTSPVAYLAWPDLFSSATALAVYLFTACYLIDPGRRLAILGVLLALAAAHMLIGARQFGRTDNFMLLQWPGTILDLGRSGNYIGRASGFYVCPNHLAGYLEIVGSLALGVALWLRAPGWVKLLFGYAGLACFGGVLLTVSRGGMIASAAALAVLGIGSIWRVRAMAPAAFGRVLLLAGVCVVVLTAAVGVAVWKSNLLKARTASTFTGQDARPLLWQAAIRQFQVEPLVGTGSGTYLYYGRRFRAPNLQLDPIHVHGDYLELLGEYGAVGALAFGLFLTAHLRAGRQTFRALLATERGGISGSGSIASNAAAWNLGALAAVAGLLVHSVVDFNLHIPANAMAMAFVCALLANPGRTLPGAAPGASAGSPRERKFGLAGILGLRLLLPALGVALLAGGLPLLPGEYWCEQARVALRDGRWLECVRLARQGLEVESRNPFIFYYLGEARFASAQAAGNPRVAKSFWEGAAEAYEQGHRLFPQDIPLLTRLGLTFSQLDRPLEAEATLREAVVWDPDSGRVHAALAYALQRAGRLPEAASEYRRAASLIPDGAVFAGLAEVERAQATEAGAGKGK